MAQKNVIEKEMAEAGTGMRQHSSGYGQIFDDKGVHISKKEARKRLIEGKLIEVPNAGAQTFRQLLADLKFGTVEVLNWTSSAGDWSFALRTREGWLQVYQENRYPYHGFRYTFGNARYESLEALQSTFV